MSVFSNLFGPGPGCCGGNIITGGGVNPPNCFCSDIPSILSLKSCNGTQAYGFIQSATLTYGPAPAAVTAACVLNFGNRWWSGPLGFDFDPGAGTFYYGLSCGYNEWILGAWLVSGPGSPYCYTEVAYWLIPYGGNTCSPFALVNGCFLIYTMMPPLVCMTVGSAGNVLACSAANPAGGTCAGVVPTPVC